MLRMMVRIACAALVSVLAVCALVPLRSHVASANLALILVLVVLGIAVVGGRAAGVVAGVTTAIAFDFFLTVPYGALAIHHSDDVQTTVLLAAVGLVGGELVERARRSQARALDRDREITRYQRRAELAAAGEPPGRLIARSAEELADLLDAVDVEYRVGSPPSEVSVLTHDGARIPGGPGAVGPDVAALPVRAHGRDLGYFLVLFPRSNAGMSVDIDRRHAAAAVADQLGVALLRHRRS